MGAPNRSRGLAQQVTRVPPYEVGDWVRISTIPEGAPGHDLSGQVRRIRSLTCAITTRAQPAVWRIHFEPDGRSVLPGSIDRPATALEAAKSRAAMDRKAAL